MICWLWKTVEACKQTTGLVTLPRGNWWVQAEALSNERVERHVCEAARVGRVSLVCRRQIVVRGWKVVGMVGMVSWPTLEEGGPLAVRVEVRLSRT